MLKVLLAAFALALLASCPAYADEDASAGNLLLGVQLADALSTRDIIAHGGYERDPLAKPFVHSNAAQFGSVVVLNIAARILLRRAPKVMRYIAIGDAVAVTNNLIDIRRFSR